MAWYEVLRSFCQQMGDNGSATLLEQTLEEEKATYKNLGGIAEASVNR